MADDFLSPFFADKVRNFTWKPWHPHRVLTHTLEPLASRLSRLQAMHARTRLGDAPYWDAVIESFLSQLLASRSVSPTVYDGIRNLMVRLVLDNSQYFEFPGIEIRSWTSDESAIITDHLDEIETRIRYEERIREAFLTGVGRIILHSLHELEVPEDAAPFQVPLYTCSSPAQLVSGIMSLITDELMPAADSIGALALHATWRQLMQNLLAVSGLTIEQFEKMPQKLVSPADCGLSPDRMVQAYLGGTGLAEFFETPIPFSIPQAARFEHCHIIGGTGHGKTQLLQSLALADFDDPSQPAIVVIDSQGDMVRKLSQLERFADSDRLIIVDPSDTEWPLALNIFDIHRERIDALSLGQREQILAGIIELYDYIFGAIGADLTQKQSVVFRYITRLMLDIPKANIQTLRQLMEDEKPFRPYIDRLTGTTRAFFDNEFSDKSFLSTKQQIRRRLYGILSNPTFERLFSSDRNKLDMASALNSGKVVLINTAKDMLKGEASSFFGRYMIALVMQAAFERAAIPEHARRPAFLYVDEAADYFDNNIDTLLIQARKYKLGVTLAHQFLDQLAPNLKASVMANPAIRFAGGVSRKDANALDSDMRTTADFLMEMRKGRGTTEFACYIRNHTRTAVALEIGLGRVEEEPRMSGSSHAALVARSRRLVAEPIQLLPAHTDLAARSQSPPSTADPSSPTDW